VSHQSVKALIFLRILVTASLDTDRPQTQMYSLLHVFIETDQIVFQKTRT